MDTAIDSWGRRSEGWRRLIIPIVIVVIVVVVVIVVIVVVIIIIGVMKAGKGILGIVHRRNGWIILSGKLIPSMGCTKLWRRCRRRLIPLIGFPVESTNEHVEIVERGSDLLVRWTTVSRRRNSPWCDNLGSVVNGVQPRLCHRGRRHCLSTLSSLSFEEVTAAQYADSTTSLRFSQFASRATGDCGDGSIRREGAGVSCGRNILCGCRQL
jgi:hypothetical protein